MADNANPAQQSTTQTGDKNSTQQLPETGHVQSGQSVNPASSPEGQHQSAHTVQSETPGSQMFGESLMTSPVSSMVVPAVLWVLIVFSIASWAMFFIKGVQFGRFKTLNQRFTRQFWGAQSLEEGGAIVNVNDGALAELARSGIAVLTGEDIGSAGRELGGQINRSERLERTLSRSIQRERRSLENGLAILASVGSTAPFVGLFGTVWGIMEALIKIGQTGQADLGSVAGPIGHALIATGVGIAAAVPAVLIYNFFVRKLKLAISDMELFSEEFYSIAQENSFSLEKTKR